MIIRPDVSNDLISYCFNNGRVKLNFITWIGASRWSLKAQTGVLSTKNVLEHGTREHTTVSKRANRKLVNLVSNLSVKINSNSEICTCYRGLRIFVDPDLLSSIVYYMILTPINNIIIITSVQDTSIKISIFIRYKRISYTIANYAAPTALISILPSRICSCC